MPPASVTTAPRITFAGGGEFGLPTLRLLLEQGYPIAQVITQPDRPAGRGRQLTPTPIARFAEMSHLPLLRTADINRESGDALASADLLVVIAFGQKIAAETMDRYPLGGINLHASLLPRYRGAAPIHWAILGGETMTGNSIIRLAQRMDAGAVLGQSHVPIDPLETTGELHDRLAADGASLMMRVVHDLAVGRADERPQDEAMATRASKLRREDSYLDWTRPAEEIARKIRGLSPWPGCHVLLHTEGKERPLRLTLLRARAVAEAPSRPALPGQINAAGQIHAGTGTVELLEVQPEGKRPMSMSDFRRGHPWPAGARVESV